MISHGHCVTSIMVFDGFCTFLGVVLGLRKLHNVFCSDFSLLRVSFRENMLQFRPVVHVYSLKLFINSLTKCIMYCKTFIYYIRNIRMSFHSFQIHWCANVQIFA